MDGRSDLYSLGVTFVPDDTGELTCATEALEWVHATLHASRLTPGEARPQSPKPLSAYHYEARRQKNAEGLSDCLGLEADLRGDWRKGVPWLIASFPLGRRRKRPLGSILRRSYGREREGWSHALRHSFDRVVAKGTPELVLGSGYAGVGKSSVVNELHKSMCPHRGFSRGARSTVQTRHSLRDSGAGRTDVGGSDPRGREPSGSETVAGTPSWKHVGTNGQLIVTLSPRWS